MAVPVHGMSRCPRMFSFGICVLFGLADADTIDQASINVPMANLVGDVTVPAVLSLICFAGASLAFLKHAGTLIDSAYSQSGKRRTLTDDEARFEMATFQRHQCPLRKGLFSLVPPERPLNFVIIPEDRMAWFEDMVGRISEVTYGIFFGEPGGAELGKWNLQAFRSGLVQLRSHVQSGRLWPSGGIMHEPLDDIALAQRLVSADLRVDKALQMINNYAKYRLETDGGAMAPALGWLESGIASFHCQDLLGRPVILVRARYHRPGNIPFFRAGLRTVLDGVKAHLLFKRGDSLSETNPLEQYVLIFDFQGAGWQNLDWDAFRCTLEEGDRHYPNFGSQVFVINVNAAVKLTWKVACGLMHPRVRRKCCFVGSKNVPDCMRRLIAPELLPREYGGTGRPWKGPESAETLEDQVGELLASVYRRVGAVPAGAKPSRDDLSSRESSFDEKAEGLTARVPCIGARSCCCF
eukprot:TRINITY_DN74413_c0_g1_i1.p1 TRINITY_DN74413_c0_g1~~TRINITY_DN74413_c0_g1_i1.p1  ORF type:complete len:466 (-),score=54.21 TRINITY_DN74413_c0_g1_i1:70-1467(-)